MSTYEGEHTIFGLLGEHHLKQLARLRRPKIVCSLLYANFRPKANAVILLDMGHTLRGEHIQEE
jgi:hypothetical protein